MGKMSLGVEMEESHNKNPGFRGKGRIVKSNRMVLVPKQTPSGGIGLKIQI